MGCIKTFILTQPSIFGNRSGLRKQAFRDEILGNLHGIRGCALAEIVSNAPEVQPIFYRRVAAYAAYEHVILAPSEQRP